MTILSRSGIQKNFWMIIIGIILLIFIFSITGITTALGEYTFTVEGVPTISAHNITRVGMVAKCLSDKMSYAAKNNSCGWIKNPTTRGNYQEIPTTQGTSSNVPPIITGLYKAYRENDRTPLITTEGITKTEALSRCQSMKFSLSKKSIRCTWNNEELYLDNPDTQTSNPELKRCTMFRSDGVIVGVDLNFTYANCEKSCNTVSNVSSCKWGTGASFIPENTNPNTPTNNPELKACTIFQYNGTTAGTSPNVAYDDCKKACNTSNNVSSCKWGAESFDPDNTSPKNQEAPITQQDAVAFGVYEGIGPSSGFRNHPEQTVYLEIPASVQGKVLVLTAYEPINWILRNPNNIKPNKIIVIGYHTQRVTSGDGTTLAPVENNSYMSNGVYQFAYSVKDHSFNSLVTWLASKKITLAANDFIGSYSAKDNAIFAKPTP